MTNEILEHARLLADAIARSTELAELHSMEDVMAADNSAQELIAELQKAQQRYLDLQQADKLSDSDINAVDELEAKVQENPAIANYMNAQDKFTEMLDSVNSILAGAIANKSNGCSCADDSCDSDGCSGGCSGCGGF